MQDDPALPDWRWAPAAPAASARNATAIATMRRDRRGTAAFIDPPLELEESWYLPPAAAPSVRNGPTRPERTVLRVNWHAIDTLP